MKTRARIFVLAVILTLIGVGLYSLFAQVETGGTPTAQQAQHYDATLYYATSATSAATLTVNGVANKYIYFNMIEIENCAGAAVTGAAPLTITTTGIGSGTTPAWTEGTTSTAGICNAPHGYWGGLPLKSNAPGTNVTFVLPTFTTNQTIRINVWFYYAP